MGDLYRKYEITCKLGYLELTVTDGDHISVTGDNIVVRGVTHKIHFHFYRRPDGQFLPRNDERWANDQGHPHWWKTEDCYIRKAGVICDDHPTLAAKTAIIPVVIEAVNHWAQNQDQNCTTFFHAAVAARREAHERLEQEKAKLRAQIAQIEQDQASLDNEPLPRDNREWAFNFDAGFDAYFAAFEAEWYRATGDRWTDPAPVRVCFDARQSIFEATEAQKLLKVAEDLGFDSARADSSRKVNPFHPSSPSHAAWEAGRERYESIRPLVECIQPLKSERC